MYVCANLTAQIQITEINIQTDCQSGGAVEIIVAGTTGAVTYSVGPTLVDLVSQDSNVIVNLSAGDYFIAVADDVSSDLTSIQISEGTPGDLEAPITVAHSLCSDALEVCVETAGIVNESDLVWYKDGEIIQWRGACLTIDNDGLGSDYQVQGRNCDISNVIDLTQAVDVDLSIEVSCVFNGIRLMSQVHNVDSYQWYKDGVPLPDADSRWLFVEENESNIGLYYVEFESDCGIEVSEEYYYNGEYILYQSFRETQICRGDTVRFGLFYLTTEGTFAYTTSAQDGCDSMAFMDIIYDDLCTNYFQGRVFYDLNENGLYDIGERLIKDVNLTVNNELAITTGRGTFYHQLEEGTAYDLSIVVDDQFEPTTTTSYSFMSTDDTHKNFYDFGLTFTDDYFETETYQSIINGRCNENGHLYVILSNLGLPIQPASEIIVEIEVDPLTTILSEGAPGGVIDGQRIGYSYPSLDYFDNKSFLLDLKFPDETNLGAVMTFTTTIRYTDHQGVEQVSQAVLEQELRCSYDPNDKLVSPVGLGDEHYTLKESDLIYTIRFQNTGNDYARNISIIDTLNPNLDLSSFSLLQTSHSVSVIHHPDREMEFLFRNIMLQDSTTNEPESHGFVTYTIKPIESLPDFTLIENTAHIYFDSNPAIVTNTTLSNLVDEFPTATEDPFGVDISLTPNPTSDRLLVEVPGYTDVQLRLFDSSYRQLLHEEGNRVSLDLKHLSDGLYFLQVLVDGVSTIRQVVVMH